jgi:predicted nucleic acid-binding protein
MKISDALTGVRKLGVDTAPFIYYVENHPVYSSKVDKIFEFAEDNNIKIISSIITLTEVLTKPIQLSDTLLEKDYRDLLTDSDEVELFSINKSIAEEAANLRARYQLRTPDALHLATAIETKCDAFLTNDKGFKKVLGIRILILDELT